MHTLTLIRVVTSVYWILCGRQVASPPGCSYHSSVYLMLCWRQVDPLMTLFTGYSVGARLIL